MASFSRKVGELLITALLLVTLASSTTGTRGQAVPWGTGPGASPLRGSAQLLTSCCTGSERTPPIPMSDKRSKTARSNIADRKSRYGRPESNPLFTTLMHINITLTCHQCPAGPSCWAQAWMHADMGAHTQATSGPQLCHLSHFAEAELLATHSSDNPPHIWTNATATALPDPTIWTRMCLTTCDKLLVATKLHRDAQRHGLMSTPLKIGRHAGLSHDCSYRRPNPCASPNTAETSHSGWWPDTLPGTYITEADSMTGWPSQKEPYYHATTNSPIDADTCFTRSATAGGMQTSQLLVAPSRTARRSAPGSAAQRHERWAAEQAHGREYEPEPSSISDSLAAVVMTLWAKELCALAVWGTWKCLRQGVDKCSRAGHGAYKLMKGLLTGAGALTQLTCIWACGSHTGLWLTLRAPCMSTIACICMVMMHWAEMALSGRIEIEALFDMVPSKYIRAMCIMGLTIRKVNTALGLALVVVACTADSCLTWGATTIFMLPYKTFDLIVSWGRAVTDYTDESKPGFHPCYTPGKGPRHMRFQNRAFRQKQRLHAHNPTQPDRGGDRDHGRYHGQCSHHKQTRGSSLFTQAPHGTEPDLPSNNPDPALRCVGGPSRDHLEPGREQSDLYFETQYNRQ